MKNRFALILIIAVCVCLSLSCSTDDDKVHIAEAFRAARQARNYNEAAKFVSSNARIWFDTKEGEGSLLNAGAGPWVDWDTHFNSSGSHGEWFVDTDSIWTIVTETNDYYRLIERRTPSQYRATYYFNKDGKIQGYLISDPYPGQPPVTKVDRFEEFKSWAKTIHSEEWNYLRPGSKIDPTGDRAKRTRKLLTLWRAEMGLPAIE